MAESLVTTTMEGSNDLTTFLSPGQEVAQKYGYPLQGGPRMQL